MKIRLIHLAKQVSVGDLKSAFESYGQVTFVDVKQEKIHGKLTRVADVEMPIHQEGKDACRELKGQNLKGKPITFADSRSGHRRQRREPRRSAGDKKGGTRGGRR